jgi:hypothetical protein
MLFLLWIELGVSLVKVTSAKNRILHFCPYSLYLLTDLFHVFSLYLLTDLFHVCLEDNLHGSLPLDGVRGQFGQGHQCSK